MPMKLVASRRAVVYGAQAFDAGIKSRHCILHLFCECAVSTSIWLCIVDWLNSLDLSSGYLTDTQILFGDKNWDPVVNRIIIPVKSIIFKNKIKSKVPTIPSIITLSKKHSLQENITSQK